MKVNRQLVRTVTGSLFETEFPTERHVEGTEV